jgi:hypothetical protein
MALRPPAVKARGRKSAAGDLTLAGSLVFDPEAQTEGRTEVREQRLLSAASDFRHPTSDLRLRTASFRGICQCCPKAKKRGLPTGLALALLLGTERLAIILVRRSAGGIAAALGV